MNDPFVTYVTTQVDPLFLDNIYGHLLAHETRVEQHDALNATAFSSLNVAPKGGSNHGRRSRYNCGSHGSG